MDSVFDGLLCLCSTFSFSRSFDWWCVWVEFTYMVVYKVISGEETLIIWTGKGFLFSILYISLCVSGEDT
jgi:hypothetical protein